MQSTPLIDREGHRRRAESCPLRDAASLRLTHPTQRDVREQRNSVLSGEFGGGRIQGERIGLSLAMSGHGDHNAAGSRAGGFPR